jgi:Na+-translocating ferredoxin:NAD+ oxidoreductase subunit G
MSILAGCSNDPVADRFKMAVDGKERAFFVGAFDGKPTTVVFEVFGKGYGDDIGLAVAINMDDDTFTGVGVTTHKETPGLGAMAKDDPVFASQFKGKPVADSIAVSQDGGDISALSGATITSRAVCAAATEAGKIYRQLKPQLADKLQQFTQ